MVILPYIFSLKTHIHKITYCGFSAEITNKEIHLSTHCPTRLKLLCVSSLILFNRSPQKTIILLLLITSLIEIEIYKLFRFSCPWTLHKWNHTVFLCIAHFTQFYAFFMFLHVHVYRYHFHRCILFYCMAISQFIYSFYERWTLLFQFLPIINKAAMYIVIHLSWGTCTGFL